MAQPHKHAAVIKAWAEGAVVEVNFPNDNEGWREVDKHPKWYDTAEYRVRHKHQQLIDEYNKGALIQFRTCVSDTWQDIGLPSWIKEAEYRIKHKHQDLIDAHVWGAKIQIKHWDDDAWTDCIPQWATNREYRIKPEPKPNLVITALVGEFNGSVALTACNYNRPDNVQFTFDGETNELIKVEKI